MSSNRIKFHQFIIIDLATVPASFRKAPGLPNPLISLGFSFIFAGAGYVVNTGDTDNGAGIATAWSLSWAFLHAKKAILSRKPLPIALLGAVTANAYVYGKKTLKVNGYLNTSFGVHLKFNISTSGTDEKQFYKKEEEDHDL
ncbi:hypothetical protein G6F52_013064 [Rhizopus delemar]|nr:hypothetical protein G6F52_013064 [Rhizopus delemar]